MRAVDWLSDVVRPSFEANRFKIAGGCARRTTASRQRARQRLASKYNYNFVIVCRAHPPAIFKSSDKYNYKFQLILPGQFCPAKLYNSANSNQVLTRARRALVVVRLKAKFQQQSLGTGPAKAEGLPDVAAHFHIQ